MKKKLLSILCVTLILNLTGCANTKSTEASTDNKAESKELVVVDWGGAFSDARKKAVYAPFEKKYNVKISAVSPTDYGKLQAMIKSGNVEWDVVTVDSDFADRGGKQGLLEKLDYNVIKTEGFDKKYISDYGIGAETFDVAISYNTKNLSKENHPTNWGDFWNVDKFKGVRSMWKYPVGTLESALLADGVKPENLYPLDVDRAFASLDKIKSNVKVWWTTGAQPPQLLANGDVNLAAAWNGRVVVAKNEGSPVEVEYNEAIVCSDSWVIPKGAKNKDLAMKFIAFASTPEQQAEFSKAIDYGPTNSKALDLLSEEVKKRIGKSSDEASTKQIIIDSSWWAENFNSVNERFEKWLLK
jgi:putative spermidine/putrescine transport system substrate-binding protein